MGAVLKYFLFSKFIYILLPVFAFSSNNYSSAFSAQTSLMEVQLQYSYLPVLQSSDLPFILLLNCNGRHLNFEKRAKRGKNWASGFCIFIASRKGLLKKKGTEICLSVTDAG